MCAASGGAFCGIGCTSVLDSGGVGSSTCSMASGGNGGANTGGGGGGTVPFDPFPEPAPEGGQVP